MLRKICDVLYRLRVRRALRREVWPLFVAFAFLVGCAHYRAQRREIDTIRRECLERIAASTPETAPLIDAECTSRIRTVEHSQ